MIALADGGLVNIARAARVPSVATNITDHRSLNDGFSEDQQITHDNLWRIRITVAFHPRFTDDAPLGYVSMFAAMQRPLVTRETQGIVTYLMLFLRAYAQYLHDFFVITLRGAAVTATHTTPVSRTRRPGEQARYWTKVRQRRVPTWPIRRRIRDGQHPRQAGVETWVVSARLDVSEIGHQADPERDQDRRHDRARRREVEHHPRRGHLLHAPREPVFEDLPLMMRSSPHEPLRVGIGGPVGSGKTALAEALCKRLRDRHDLFVVSNDICTREDQRILTEAGALLPAGCSAITNGWPSAQQSTQALCQSGQSPLSPSRLSTSLHRRCQAVTPSFNER